MKNIKYQKPYYWSILTSIVTFLGVALLLTQPSIVKADISKANGQVFMAIEDLDDRVSTIERGMQFYTLGMRAFQPRADTFYINDSSIGAYARPDSFDRLLAPINLPDGAKVERVDCFFYDKDPINDLGCYLGKSELETGVISFAGQVFSAGDDNGHILKNFILEEAINNFEYSYFIQISPNPELLNHPNDPPRSHKWGFDDNSQSDDFGPLTTIKGVRIRYSISESSRLND